MIHLILNDEAAALPQAQQQLIQNCIERTLTAEDFPYDAEVSFSITDDEGIHRLNLEQRGIDRATDVLSFPMLTAEDGVLIVEDTDFIDDRVFWVILLCPFSAPKHRPKPMAIRLSGNWDF